MPEPISATASLRAGLHALVEAVEGVSFRLPSPHRPDRLREREEVAWSIRQYLLPRLADLEGPVVAVVLGSTGSGKSTLVNSLAGASITEAGAMRPTTLRPVIWTHQRHRHRYEGEFLSGYGPDASKPLRVVEDENPMLEDLTILDAPDFDSLVAENREMADELLAIGDLCVFMTTAQRYADAVPWEFLRRARGRGLPILYVVNRLPPDPEGRREILADYAQRLAEHELILEPDPAVLFTISEQPVDGEDGALPARAVEPIRRELSLLADRGLRDQLIRQATEGAVAEVVQRGRRLADMVEVETAEAEGLAELARAPYGRQAAEVARLLREGTLIRREVLARWQEFVGTGDLIKTLAGGAVRVRGWLRGVLGGTTPVERAEVDAVSELVAAVVRRADLAAREAAASWERDPIGKNLLVGPVSGGGEDLWRHGPDLPESVGRAVREWMGEVARLVAELGEGKRRGARAASLGVNAVAVTVLLGVFAQTGGVTGAELGVAAGAAAAQQKLLEHLVGSAAARSLAEEARRRLGDRLTAALETDAGRFERLVREQAAPANAADRIRARADEVSRLAGEFYRA